MRKLISTVAVLLLAFNLSAQYKKASFFEKEGRTYELTSQVYMMGEGNGSPIGYKLAFGRDKEGKRLFYSWDLQLIPSHKYSYVTTDDNETTVTVSGNSKSIIVYGLNWGYHLLNNDADKKHMLQPFISAGMNLGLRSGIKNESYSPETYSYLKRNTATQALSFGINGGLGCIVNFSSKWALKLQGGIDRQFNMSGQNWDDEVKPFFVFDSYKYVSLGLRLRIESE